MQHQGRLRLDGAMSQHQGRLVSFYCYLLILAVVLALLRSSKLIKDARNSAITWHCAITTYNNGLPRIIRRSKPRADKAMGEAFASF